MPVDEFITFLAGLDSKPAPEPVLKAVAASFIDGGLTAPSQLVGVIESDIATSLTMAAKALARRAIRAANAPVSPAPGTSSTVMVETTASQPQPIPSPPLSNDVNDLVGPYHSAAVVADLMAHTTDLNETDLMSAAGFLTLPIQLRPDPLVWRVLRAENVAALARGRKPFSYVDLTAKELLPLWLAPDTIGGKTPAGADWVQCWIRMHLPQTWHSLAEPYKVPQQQRSSLPTLSGKQLSTNTVLQRSPSSRSVGTLNLPTRMCSFNSWRKRKRLLQVFFSLCCAMISFVVNLPGAHWQVNQSWTSTNVSSHVMILSWKRHVFDSRPFWSLLVWYQHPRHWQRPLSLPVVLM